MFSPELIVDEIFAPVQRSSLYGNIFVVQDMQGCAYV